MRLFLYPLLAAFISCQHKSSFSFGPERIEAAFISADYLYVDGCKSHVRVLTRDSSGTAIYHKPTPATLPILQQALATIPPTNTSSERAVTIQFAETGRKVMLLCGWVNKPDTDEIEILEIIPC